MSPAQIPTLIESRLMILKLRAWIIAFAGCCLVFNGNLTVPSAADEPLVSKGAAPQRIDADFVLADGPCWNGNTVIISDVKNGTVHHWNPTKQELGSFSRAKGTFSGTFYQLDAIYFANNPKCRIEVVPNKGKPYTLYELPEGHRPNDLVVDGRGNVFMTLTKQGQIAVVTPGENGATITTLVDGLVTPNGIALSPDENTLYVSEMKPRVVTKFKLKRNEGSILAGEPSRFATMNPDPSYKGGGDGMTVDRSGDVYCAGADGVYVWNPNGELIEKIEFPSRPINCIIGGRKQPMLYTTCFDGVYRLPVNRYPRLAQKSDADDPQAAPPIETINDVVYHTVEPDGRQLLADIHRPANDDVLPAVVYVHGGGWLHGDKSSTRRMARRMTCKGYVTMSVEYRLGYESPFPAGVQDVHAAIAFLQNNASKYGVDPDRIAAAGGSAGGHIVGLVGVSSDLPSLLPPEAGKSQLQAVMVIAGPLEIVTGSVAKRSTGAGPVSNAENWIRGTIDEKRDLFQLADVFSKIDKDTPPMLFQSGSLDSPERNQPTRDRMNLLGIFNQLVVYEGGVHGVWNQEKWVDQYVDDQDAFLKSAGF